MLNRFLNGHSLTLLWFADLMNLTEEVTIHRPNVSTLRQAVSGYRFQSLPNSTIQDPAE